MLETIFTWYRSIGGEVGILIEALNAIKSVSYRLIGTLIFDKMTIRQHVNYFKDKFVGYVNYGNDIECDTTKVAKYFVELHKLQEADYRSAFSQQI